MLINFKMAIKNQRSDWIILKRAQVPFFYIVHADHIYAGQKRPKKSEGHSPFKANFNPKQIGLKCQTKFDKDSFFGKDWDNGQKNSYCAAVEK